MTTFLQQSILIINGNYIITDFCKEVNRMYNFNGSKKKKQVIAIVALVLIAALTVTSVLAALFVG